MVKSLSFCWIVLSFVGLVSSEYLFGKEKIEQAEFLQFVQKFGKNYKNIEEAENRRKVFEDNLMHIKEVNAQGLDWVLGVNDFTDLTPEEFSEKLLGEVETEQTDTQEFHTNLRIPISVDWRAKGVVTPIMNQGSCSCGYAFASVGALESAWALNGHKLTMLSVQQALDCSSGNKGCTSGTANNCFTYMQASGLTNATIYPYSGSSGRCNKTAAAIVVAKSSKYISVTSSSSDALLSAIALQPIAVGVDANTAIWQSYAGGTVTSTTCGTTINHFVLAVGYATADPVPYYIVKNSWGPAWGKDGFMQIAVANGAGICGIQVSPSYPVV